MINEIYIKNIRGFKELSKTKIRRLTVLVGENSSGKTTFLGVYNAFSKLLHRDDNLNSFKCYPFDFGKFENICHKGEKEFLLGGSINIKNKGNLSSEYIFKKKSIETHNENIDFTEKVGQFKFNDALEKEIVLNIKKEENNWNLSTSKIHFTFHSDVISQKEISSWLSKSVSGNILPYHGEDAFLKRYKSNVSDKEKVAFNEIIQALRQMPLLEKDMEVIPLPPVQREQKRYQELNPLEKETIQKSIAQIGKKMGLFSDIYSKKTGDLYELIVKIFNEGFNIKDVGFGISSILPFLKEFSKSGFDKEAIFLLQQPENHLHPSAQAEMTQLLAQSKSHFLIETHSDHIIKRLRICIMKKVITPDELQILYFEKGTNGSLKIHEIEVDKDGNLENPPPSYKSFFLKERDDFLGFN